MTASVKNQGNQSHYSGGTLTLAGGATFAMPVVDACPGFTRVRASAFQDQAGSLTIEQSNDPLFATVRSYSTTAIVASTLVSTVDVLIYRRYVRVRASNTSGTPLTNQEVDVVYTTL